MEFGLPIGVQICCLSLILIMLNQWYSGIYWFIIGLIFIIDRFNEFGLFNKKQKVFVPGNY